MFSWQAIVLLSKPLDAITERRHRIGRNPFHRALHDSILLTPVSLLLRYQLFDRLADILSDGRFAARGIPSAKYVQDSSVSIGRIEWMLPLRSGDFSTSTLKFASSLTEIPMF
jgi:hypothetical protein